MTHGTATCSPGAPTNPEGVRRCARQSGSPGDTGRRAARSSRRLPGAPWAQPGWELAGRMGRTRPRAVPPEGTCSPPLAAGGRSAGYDPARAKGVTEQLGVSKTLNEAFGAWSVLGRAWSGRRDSVSGRRTRQDGLSSAAVTSEPHRPSRCPALPAGPTRGPTGPCGQRKPSRSAAGRREGPIRAGTMGC